MYKLYLGTYSTFYTDPAWYGGVTDTHLSRIYFVPLHANLYVVVIVTALGCNLLYK